MNRTSLILACVCGALLGAATTATAQEAPGSRTRPPEQLLIHARLYALQTDLESGARQPEAAFQRAGVRVDGRGRVLVELIAPRGDQPVGTGLFEAVGGRLQYRSEGTTFGWVPPRRLMELAALAPPGHQVVPAHRPSTTDQGPGLMGSADYQGSGLGGDGLRIGIIDNGFDGLDDVISLGLAKTPAKTWPDGDDFDNTDPHGRECYETLFDHAPQADYYLYNVALRPLPQAIDEAIGDGVDMISMSLSFFQRWDDGVGSAAQALQDASDATIPVFVSAGNYRDAHYQGTFTGSNVHEFGTDPGTGLADINWNFEVGLADTGIPCTEDTVLDVVLLWDRDGILDTDLDLYLYEAGGFLVDSSESIFGDRESVTLTLPAGSVEDYYVRVNQFGSDPVEFELFLIVHDGCASVDPSDVEESSSLSPSANSPASLVVTCGAVDRDHWTQTSPSLTDYSSMGPTNNGANGLDVVGPTDTEVFDTLVSGGFSVVDFGGTSCATPNAAGAAAAFWSAHPDMTAGALVYLLERQADLFADWGVGGEDTSFGSGGVHLYEHHPDTVWIDTAYPIDWEDFFPATFKTKAFGPYWRFADALEAVPGGGRIVMIDHAETGAYDVEKEVRLDAIGGTASLGGAP